MKLFVIDELHIDEAVARAVELLRAGEVIALPTDTVYGLAADAWNEAAIEKVFALKGRAADKALPVFVSSFEMLESVAFLKDERVRRFLAGAWPGAVTAILPARGWLPLSLRGGLLTVAVRIPNNLFVQKVIEQFGGPITGTSANISGHQACIRANDVVEEFKHLPLRPSMIFDDGSESLGEASTIMDCTVFPPRIMRSGAVAKEKISAWLADL